jgi:Flp pilus assembly protein TadG
VRSARRLQRGQVVVEFTLAASVMFLLVFGIIDFTRALFAYDQVTYAARIGARYAIVRGTSCTVTGCPATPATIKTYVFSKVTGLDTTKMTVVPTWTTGPGCTDAAYQGPLCNVAVNVTYTFPFILGYGRTITMTSTSQMTISQ